MSFSNQTSQDTALSIQGCGYKIENDRVIINIDQISSHRDEMNMSGTLLIELCALSQQTSKPEVIVLASTSIGEIKGQHFLSTCYYDLLFQHPPAGIWQLSLQLSEWNGVDYTLVDKVLFGVLYQTQAMTDEADAYHANHATSIELQPKQEELKEPITQTDTSITSTHNIGNGHLIINKAKAAKLKVIKGVPKKSLEKIIAERPFQSEQAIMNIKGMGSKMLLKVLDHLSK
jgi:DNA uptake protein ComE-like DNA-binding protein